MALSEKPYFLHSSSTSRSDGADAASFSSSAICASFEMKKASIPVISEMLLPLSPRLNSSVIIKILSSVARLI